MQMIGELSGYLKDGAVLKKLTIRISSPITVADDSFCVVHLSPILDSDRKIFGIDGEQAFSLAKGFVCEMLEGVDVFDEQKFPLNLDVLKRSDLGRTKD